MASTVLPNGIIIPEKYSRDWYNDLYHNWQELDNLLAGGTPKDGTLTIQKNGSTVGTFSANQSTDETINITVPDVNDATLTIQQNGTDVVTFSANSSTNATANIEVPTKTSDLTNDSGFITSDNTKIPLAGSNAISGSLIPATDNAYNLGDSTYGFANFYTNKMYLKGSTIFNVVDDNYICVGGATAQANGANLVLNGKNRSTSTGEFKLEARDGTNTRQLIGKPDGTLAWNNKNVAMQEDTVPRSGGAVLSGQDFKRTVDDSTLNVYGGNGYGHGALLQLTGKDEAGGGAFNIQAHNGSTNVILRGKADGTLTWNGQSIQTISDQRLKQQITEIDDKLLDAWEDVELSQFKYNDAVNEKGTNARLHTGYVVQQIDKACKSHGVDVSQYGLYCHEEYPEETEEVEIEQADGTKVKERKVIREASEHYSLRYTEVYAVECMYLRRCIERLTARIEELEKGNNTK